MAKKPKGSEKIRFFRIGGRGSIESAFPDRKPEEGTATAAHRQEPVLGEGAADNEAPVDAGSFSVREADPRLEEQLHLLQPQIEDISRIPVQSELSQDQVDILRRYIALKEAEVRDLRDQRRQYQNFLKRLSSQMENHSDRSRDLVRDLEALRRRNETLVAENRRLREKYQEEVKALRADYEEKLQMAGAVDLQVDQFSREREDWKQKIKEDLKRIKLKEKELENKYELLKRDSQALLDSKDRHVLELKKKCDALELELESLEERLRKANFVLAAIDSRKKRLLETFKLATSLLEEIDQEDVDPDAAEAPADGTRKKTG